MHVCVCGCACACSPGGFYCENKDPNHGSSGTHCAYTTTGNGMCVDSAPEDTDVYLADGSGLYSDPNSEINTKQACTAAQTGERLGSTLL